MHWKAKAIAQNAISLLPQSIGDALYYIRVDDFLRLFRQVGLDVLTVDAKVDTRARRELANGFPLDPGFRGRDPDALATVEAWFVAKAP
jgi:hypothetical protein